MTPLRPALRSRKERRARYRKGWLSEWAAAVFLMAKGYSILSWRFKCRAGEIDIVARRGRRIAFVEVKARRNAEQALTAVTRRQKERIFRAAEIWMQKHEGYKEYDRSFDLITVVPSKGVTHHMQFFTW